MDIRINPFTITGRIYAKIFELLEAHPGGLRWVDLLKKIKESDPTFHPKTVNGCVWKMVEKFPDKVYKPAKGLFRLFFAGIPRAEGRSGEQSPKNGAAREEEDTTGGRPWSFIEI